MNNLALMEELLDADPKLHRETISLTEQATEWLTPMDDDHNSSADNKAFCKWLGRSPRHVAEFLRMCVVHHELQALAAEGVLSKTDREARGDGKVVPLFNLQSRRAGLEERRLHKLWHAFSEKSGASERKNPGRKSQTASVGALYAQYRNILMRMLRSRGMDPDSAEDVLHDTFLAFLKQKDKPGAAQIRNLDAYLYAMASNAAVNFARRHSRVSYRAFPDEELESIEDPRASVEQRVIELDLIEKVRELLRTLPQEGAHVMYRALFLGETSADMSAALGMSRPRLLRVFMRSRSMLTDLVRKMERGWRP